MANRGSCCGRSALRLGQISSRFKPANPAGSHQGNKPILNPRKETMKIRLLLTLAGLAVGLALPSFAQQTKTPAPGTTKEINFSGTHYWSSTPKVFQIDPERLIVQLDIFGVRVNDSGDGPFHGASVYIALVTYVSKGYNRMANPLDPIRSRAYETWTDKDGDKVIWELIDTPSGASSSTAKLI